MRYFPPGSRVLRTETGEVGTVRRQLLDGSVTLTFDDGRPAELQSLSLQLHHEDPAQLTGLERLRLAIVDPKRCGHQIKEMFLETEIESEDDITEVVDFLWLHRPNVIRELATALYRAKSRRN